jgi:prepilin-type N-terminal cleavage/methylation domain-containing protein
MSILRKTQRAFTIIETMIAVSVFSILILGALSLEMIRVNLKAYDNIKEKEIYNVELLKNNIINNTSYSELEALLNEGKKYIIKDNITSEYLQKDIRGLFQNNFNEKESYIEVILNNQLKGHITIKYYYVYGKLNEVLLCDFYKGNYQ